MNDMPNLGIIFLTGLLAGGISCAAVQGALLATMGTDRKKVFLFLGSKLIAHIILGGILGLLGEVFKISIGLTAAFQIAISIYVMGVALAMLDVHPFFRRFLWQTPKFLGRYLRNTSKSEDWSAPLILGAGTVFIPCGVTQGMMAVSMASGSFLSGALVLGVFVLGTSPVFLALGLAVTTLGDKFRKWVAYALIAVSLWTLNGGLVMAGSPITAQKVLAGAECALTVCKSEEVVNQEATDEVTISFLNNRYETDKKVVKAGSKIKLNLVNKAGYGCIQAFTIPALNISKVVPPGKTQTLEVTVPDNAGKLDFSCSMGMYTGQLTIVN